MKNEQDKYIVLIDDEPLNNLIHTKIIRHIFHSTILAFTDARQALDRIRLIANSREAEFIQLIFLDINMPEMDGWEFLEEFEKLPKNFLKNSAVVMLTSSVDTRDLKKARSFESVKEFISKPLIPEKLRLLIKD